MILSSATIFELATARQMITPFVPKKMIHAESGLSYGLQPCAYDLCIAQEITLYPHDFVLASTVEKVFMPNNICAFVHDKSSWARRGVVVQNTHFDPGFRGVPAIEITHHGRETIHIVAGTPICQLVFHRLDKPTSPYDGKYQDQPAGPQEWKRDVDQS